jgi:hypothetical protein
MTNPRDPDRWFKSTRSASNADCVEVRTGRTVGVRDTKDRVGGELAIPAAGWTVFLAGLKVVQVC